MSCPVQSHPHVPFVTRRVTLRKRAAAISACQPPWLPAARSSVFPSHSGGMDPESNASRETSYWKDVALRAIRYLQWITTLPEWDGKTLELAAGSQGGWAVSEDGGLT